MGLSFHKSIKLPFGLRLNLSKSGLGFSWGTKGFRVSKDAKGNTRKTVSVPGTGISYVTSSSGKKKNTTDKKKVTSSNNSTKLKEVYLNEETGEIIEKGNAKTKEVKSFDNMVDDLAEKVGEMIDK